MNLGSLKSFTATQLRMTLSISLFVIAILGGVMFSFANGQLEAFATEVSHVSIDADASRNNVQTLQTIQKELEENKDVITFFHVRLRHAPRFPQPCRTRSCFPRPFGLRYVRHRPLLCGGPASGRPRCALWQLRHHVRPGL